MVSERTRPGVRARHWGKPSGAVGEGERASFPLSPRGLFLAPAAPVPWREPLRCGLHSFPCEVPPAPPRRSSHGCRKPPDTVAIYGKTLISPCSGRSLPAPYKAIPAEAGGRASRRVRLEEMGKEKEKREEEERLKGQKLQKPLSRSRRPRGSI